MFWGDSCKKGQGTVSAASQALPSISCALPESPCCDVSSLTPGSSGLSYGPFSLGGHLHLFSFRGSGPFSGPVSRVHNITRSSDGTLGPLRAPNPPSVSAGHSALELPVGDDFDTLVSAAMRADSICALPTCSASVVTLGQLCLHCRRRYCLSHHLPEVGGRD